MPNAITHPIHAQVSRSLIAAVLVSVGLLVGALTLGVHPRTDAAAIDTVVEWGD